MNTQNHHHEIYYVYIMSSKSFTLYVGITSNLIRRVYEHKHKLIEGFTSRYNVNRLVWYETTSDVRSAIIREKELKGWTRKRKVDLVTSSNPQWLDLSKELFN